MNVEGEIGRENPRTCPWTVKLAGWLIIAWSVVGFINGVMRVFQKTQHWKLASFAGVIAWMAFWAAIWIVLAVDMLRGKSWAYYVLVVLYVLGVISAPLVARLQPVNHGMLWLAWGVVISALLIAQYRQYKAFASQSEREQWPPDDTKIQV